MSAFCIPRSLAEKMKAAAQRGEIDMGKMYDMTTKERNALFSKYVEPEIAKQINTQFEKAMISKQQNALKKWAEEVFVGSEEKKKQKVDVYKKIEALTESGILTKDNEKAFLGDLVADKIGVGITTDQASQIVKLSEKLQAEAKNESEYGTPTLEYFKARREMDDYIASLNPSSKIKLLSSTVGRGNMLLRVSSTLLNIESNTIQGVLQGLQRRFEKKSVGGANAKYASDYAKYVNQIYQETGYDITRMLTLDGDTMIRGEEQLTTQGPGKVREIARWYEDNVFKKLQGAPDVLFSSIAFSDRANIESTKLAQSEGLKGEEEKARALEIFKDATRIDPKTKEGQAIRDSAMADSFYSTYTNKTVYSDIALGIRKVFNLIPGDARIGDQIMPFVKTPANVIGAGIDMSGIGVPLEAGYRMFKVFNDIKEGTRPIEAMKSEFKGFSKTIIRAGFGLVFTTILSSLFKPDDFIGEYPVSEKERQLLALRNAAPNSVKIGDKWVSIDYFGSLGAPLIGMLYAKKYGKNLPESVYNYVKGVIKRSAKIPGFDETYNTIKALQEITPKAHQTINDEIRNMTNYMIGFVQSRSTPGILYDIAKMTDSSERATDRNDVLSKLKFAIPGVRQTLPEKKNIFGETVNTEPWYSILFTGSRVKTSKDNAITAELQKLNNTGNLPSITDVSRTSPRAAELRDQIGQEKFDQAMEWFGTNLKKGIDKTIRDPAYKRLPEDKKQNKINSVKSNLFEEMLKKYHYKKAKK